MQETEKVRRDENSDGQPMLEFAEEYVAPIIDGTKTATVRLDDADEIAVGDRVAAVTPSGNEFATLETRRTATALAVEAIGLINLFGAAYSSETVDELLEGVNQHYSETIRPSTTVRIIVFEEVDDAE